MIFKKIELFNFGIYRGKHSIDLMPKEGKPIILIGGLNGRGKTTLIDAFQLALYGKFAKCSNRKKLPYEQYLLESINNQVSKTDGASLTLELLIKHQRKTVTYTMTRTWKAQQGKVSEFVEVLVNDEHDPMLSESWDQFIQQIIPLEISEFVFFDGEKIEQLADPSKSKKLVEVGVKSLLGINLISDLISDLKYLPRRYKKQQQATTSGMSRTENIHLEQQREQIHRNLTTAQEHHKLIVQELGSLQLTIDNLEQSLSDANKMYQDIGGDLHEMRENLLVKQEVTKTGLQVLQESYVRLAEGPAPLALIAPMVKNLQNEATKARRAQRNEQVLEYATTRDSEIIDYLSKKVDPETLSTIREAQTATLPTLEEDVPDYLDGIDLTGLVNYNLEPAIADFKAMNENMEKMNNLRAELDKIQRQMDAMPSDEQVQQMTISINEIEQQHLQSTTKKGILLDDKTKTTQKIAELENKLNEVHRQIAKDTAETELETKMLDHTPTLIETLEKFKTALGENSIHKIESKISSCFNKLIGKVDLVGRICIDPESFSVSLLDSRGDKLPGLRLSAGERQLLAIAFIWGLSGSAPASLPAIVDTPLGRLDSIHRQIMFEKYFPYATDQVILLTTDEEINTQHHETIAEYITHEYTLSYNLQSQSTHVFSGYNQLLTQVEH